MQTKITEKFFNKNMSLLKYIYDYHKVIDGIANATKVVAVSTLDIQRRAGRSTCYYFINDLCDVQISNFKSLRRSKIKIKFLLQSVENRNKCII